MPDLDLRTAINLFSLFGALFAFWQGRAPERVAAAVVVVNVLVGQSTEWFAAGSDDVIRLFNDGLTALALLAVTLRYGAPWMGGVMLFFAAQFSLHSYYLVMNRPQSDRLHAMINNIDWTGIAWCLIVGTAVAWRQRVLRARQSPAA
jgi:hypothetical protein